MQNSKQWMMAMGAAALMLAGCSGSSEPAGTRYEVWMRGANSDQYTSALVSARGLVASADGKTLETRVRPTAHNMELTAADPYRVGYIYVPDGAQQVEVAVVLDEFGGYEHQSGAGAIDARSAPIRFTASIAELKTHGHAVVQLDLQHSLVKKPRSDERMLLANTVVGF